jgi:uncharacterized protein involved in tolerance to divalent cations
MSLTLISKNLEQADEIASFLIKEKLVIEANLIDSSKCYLLGENNEVIKKNAVTIICTTKSLLFNKIDNYLKDTYRNDMPTMYSVPVTSMDWEQSKILVEGTQSV